MKTILIAIPTNKYIEVDTFKSIYDLVIPEGYETEFQYSFGYQVSQIRNKIASWAEYYDYVLCVDSDIVLPHDTLMKMLAHDKDIISGVYRQRLEPQSLEIYNLNYAPYKELPAEDFLEIGGCGFGCVLVKSEVFTKIGYPQFEYHSALDHANTFSEDLDFCVKAKKKGYKIYADTTIICDHIGSRAFRVEPKRMQTSTESPVQKRLRELANQDLLPQDHVHYLYDMKDDKIEPKVIWDLGSCVMHWTRKAKEVWPNASFIGFEAMNETEFLYREAGIPAVLGYALSDKDWEQVEFYQNLEHPGGNSMYKESRELSPRADELFPESAKVKKQTRTLDSLQIEYKLPLPDLIKMDIQGAELSVLRGAKAVLKNCKNLILELQHLDYNEGAPKAQEVIEYLKGEGWILASHGPFCSSSLGVDGDYHFVRAE